MIVKDFLNVICLCSVFFVVPCACFSNTNQNEALFPGSQQQSIQTTTKTPTTPVVSELNAPDSSGGNPIGESVNNEAVDTPNTYTTKSSTQSLRGNALGDNVEQQPLTPLQEGSGDESYTTYNNELQHLTTTQGDPDELTNGQGSGGDLTDSNKQSITANDISSSYTIQVYSSSLTTTAASTASTQQVTAATASTQQTATATASAQQAAAASASTQKVTTATASTQQTTAATASTQKVTTATASTQQVTTATASTQQAAAETASTQQAAAATASTQQVTTTVSSTQFTTPLGSTQQTAAVTTSTQQATTTVSSTQFTTPLVSTQPAITSSLDTNTNSVTSGLAVHNPSISIWEYIISAKDVIFIQTPLSNSTKRDVVSCALYCSTLTACEYFSFLNHFCSLYSNDTYETMNITGARIYERKHFTN